jgi:hypothetical protein
LLREFLMKGASDQRSSAFRRRPFGTLAGSPMVGGRWVERLVGFAIVGRGSKISAMRLSEDDDGSDVSH